MLIPLDYIVLKYNIKFTGILHVGAHECEEIYCYEKYINRDKILWIEAIEDKVNFCKRKFPNINIENEIISDKEENITFNISNNYQSSSILELGTHKQLHPHIHYISSFTKKSKRLDNIINKYNINYNFINLDIQGAELKALKSMESYLNNIDYIYTEVNGSYVYKDCNLISELDNYLKQFNLYRVETKWYNNDNTTWGDAFYIKK
jgi:FkbM family methyltransferase